MDYCCFELDGILHFQIDNSCASQLISASWLNGIGAGLRVVACMDFLSQHWRYPVLMVGQGLTGCAQPLIMFATTKLAAQWFGDRQRALANMIGSMGEISFCICNIDPCCLNHGCNLNSCQPPLPF